ncbi:MAG: hypothetical protein J7L21_07490 [Sulfurimonas sp.]|nr:hypothetical protein [Sulfurimonas sp.]
MTNLEYMTDKIYSVLIPTDMDGVDALVLIMFTGITIYVLNKLLTNSKYENTLIVKLIHKIF